MQSEATPKPRLILHAGMPKTGTTSIQRTLCDPVWKEALDSRRIRFMQAVSLPSVRGEYRAMMEDGDIVNLANCSPYFNALRRAPRRRSAAEHETLVGAMTADIGSLLSGLPPGFSVLISAESVGDIALRDPDALRHIRNYLLGFFSDVSVVLYLREPLSYACSRVQQGVKAGYPLPTALRGALIGCNSLRAIRHIREVFGKSSLVVRPFDPAVLTSGDVVADFAGHVMGIPEAAFRELRAERADANRGLPMEVLDVLLRFYAGRGITERSIRRGFAGKLGKINWVGTKFSPAFFPDMARNRLLEVTGRVRAALRERMGYDLFPSYRPFQDGAWRGSETAPEIHERNAGLLRDFIAEIMKEREAAEASGDTTLAPFDPAVLARPEGETAQDAFLRLLGELYGLCRPKAT